MLQLLAAFLNLSMLVPFKSRPMKGKLELGILVMNILVALSIAIDYILIGKTYIQYAWMLVAIMSCVTLLIKLRRRNPEAKALDNQQR